MHPKAQGRELLPNSRPHRATRACLSGLSVPQTLPRAAVCGCPGQALTRLRHGQSQLNNKYPHPQNDRQIKISVSPLDPVSCLSSSAACPLPPSPRPSPQRCLPVNRAPSPAPERCQGPAGGVTRVPPGKGWGKATLGCADVPRLGEPGPSLRRGGEGGPWGTSPTAALPIASNRPGGRGGGLPLLSVGAAAQGDALAQAGGRRRGWPADTGGRSRPRRGKQLWQGGGDGVSARSVTHGRGLRVCSGGEGRGSHLSPLTSATQGAPRGARRGERGARGGDGDREGGREGRDGGPGRAAPTSFPGGARAPATVTMPAAGWRLRAPAGDAEPGPAPPSAAARPIPTRAGGRAMQITPDLGPPVTSPAPGPARARPRIPGLA